MFPATLAFLLLAPGSPAEDAIARYRSTMERLWDDATIVFAAAAMTRTPNARYLQASLQEADAGLALVDADLARALEARDFSLELCIACWEVDWNRSGRIDEGDRRLFEVEVDADGAPIPEGDPRRRPTFRFDRGDLFWARAMIAFQRAALRMLLAYEWSESDGRITFRLRDAEPMREAHALILRGLEHSARCRKEYLLEKDDDREWVPNPKQKHHPLPLPVDRELYRTWAEVLDDVEKMMRGKEGVPLAKLAEIAGQPLERPPEGYLDLERFFLEPGDIVIDRERVVLGRAQVKKMKPTPLLGRLERMKTEASRGGESLERKLKYLLWLN